jgi:transposase
MIYVRQPTEEERQELRRMTQQEVGRVALRAQMILLSAQRRTVPEIAGIFAVESKTVGKWMRRFDAKGPAGLYDESRPGRPRKLTESACQQLVAMVQQDPERSGYLASLAQPGGLSPHWTVAMVVLALAKELGLRVSPATVRGALHQAHLAWGRPRLSMPRKTDPQKAAEQWQIAQAVIEAGPQATVLYADESRIQLLPLVRAMWHQELFWRSQKADWVGAQIRVPTPGSNVTRALFGALNINTGQWTYLASKRMRKQDFIAFLEHLLTVYATGPIILIVDNYSSHTAGAVKAWLAEHDRLQLFYLPTYCSHLNPVESIWLRLKNQIAANRLHGSMKSLMDCVDRFFTDMTHEQALTWAAA